MTSIKYNPLIKSGLDLVGANTVSPGPTAKSMTSLFRSKQSGNYDNPNTWEVKLSDGTWTNAVEPPNLKDEIRIQGDLQHTITLSRNERIFNLFFNPLTGIGSNSHILITNGFELNVFGTIGYYEGTPDEFNVAPSGAEISLGADTIWIDGDVGGGLVWRGQTRRCFPADYYAPNTLWAGTYYTKILLDTPQDVLISEEGNTLIVNGFILVGGLQSAESFDNPDGSVSISFLRTHNDQARTTGDLFVGTQGKLIGWHEITNHANNAIDNLTVETGGQIVCTANDSTDDNIIRADNFDYKGTEIYEKPFNQFFYERTGTSSFSEKSVVSIGGSGDKILQEDSTIHNNLIFKESGNLNLNGFKLYFGNNGNLSYINDDRTTTNFEFVNSFGSNIPFNLIVDSCTVTLNGNKKIRGNIILLNNASIDYNGFSIESIGNSFKDYGVHDTPTTIITQSSGSDTNIDISSFDFSIRTRSYFFPNIENINISPYLLGESGVQIGISPTNTFSTSNPRISTILNINSTGFDIIFKKFNLATGAEEIKFSDDEKENLIELGPARNDSNFGGVDGNILSGSIIPAFWKSQNGSYENTLTHLEKVRSGFSLTRNNMNNEKLDIGDGVIITRNQKRLEKPSDISIDVLEVFEDGVSGYSFIPTSNYSFKNQYDNGTGTLQPLSNNNFTRHSLLFEPETNLYFVIIGKENINSTTLRETNPKVDYGPFIGNTQSGLIDLAVIVMDESTSTNIFEIIPTRGATGISTGGTGGTTNITLLSSYSGSITGSLNGNTNYTITIPLVGATIGDKVISGFNDSFIDDLNTSGQDSIIRAFVSSANTVMVTYRINSFLAENILREVWVQIIK